LTTFSEGYFSLSYRRNFI